MTRTLVGNIASARRIAAYVEADAPMAKPKGFRYLGEGCYRTAYLEKSTKTVYKVETGGECSNYVEVDNARRLIRKSTRSLGFDLTVVRTRLFDTSSSSRWGTTVNAQEFAIGADITFCEAEAFYMDPVPDCSCRKPFGLCFVEVQNRVKDWSGLQDVHSENILVDKKGMFWLIDMGC